MRKSPQEAYGGTFALHQLANIVSSASQCPFCYDTENLAPERPKRHIAEHLEELSLLGLFLIFLFSSAPTRSSYDLDERVLRQA